MGHKLPPESAKKGSVQAFELESICGSVACAIAADGMNFDCQD
jgi:hypothetical protein